MAFSPLVLYFGVPLFFGTARWVSINQIDRVAGAGSDAVSGHRRDGAAAVGRAHSRDARALARDRSRLAVRRGVCRPLSA